MPFFQYRQNNSGGQFTGPAIHVIIEADSADEADQRAVNEAGLYFDGCAQDIDCSCCGDRWHRAWDDGDDEPRVYDEPWLEYKPTGFLSMYKNIPQVVLLPKGQKQLVDASKLLAGKTEA